jgi:superfamily I DNA/RNA helicase
LSLSLLIAALPRAPSSISKPLARRRLYREATFVLQTRSRGDEALLVTTVMDTTALDRVAGMVARASEGRSSAEWALFSQLRVERDGRVKDYLVGSVTDVDGEVAVLHWRNAPLSRLMYECDEGDLFEFAGAQRPIEGKLLERHIVHTDREGALVALERNGQLFERREGAWIAAGDATPALALRDAQARARPRTPVDVTLDDAQRAAVQRQHREALLVLGEAGAGKTTVALHRVAWLDRLRRQRNDRAEPLKVLVVAPTEGLRRLLRTSLERLGVARADVVQFDRWATSQARRAFERIPARDVYFDAPMSVLRVKRSRALRAVIAQYARRRRKGRVSRDDLHELFGDRALIAPIASAADVEAVAQHTRAQFRSRTEDAYASLVDADRLQTADGRSIDSATPDDLAGRIDAEDAPVLFELARYAGQPYAIERYDCVVVDEAQELAPLELALIGDALAPGGALIVAGDASQQVDATSSYESWRQTLADLGAQHFSTVKLETSYRCPAPVTELARAILREPDGVFAHPIAEGERVRRWADTSEAHLLARACQSLRALRREDRTASIAVVARTEESAQRWSTVLGPALAAHYAREGDFTDDHAVHVCSVREVKGLEFDYVLALDATSGNYPSAPQGRHALYVAVTRATHTIVLGAVNPR